MDSRFRGNDSVGHLNRTGILTIAIKGRVEKPADYHHLRLGRARLPPSRRVEHAVAARREARPPEGSDSRGLFNMPLKARGTQIQTENTSDNRSKA